MSEDVFDRALDRRNVVIQEQRLRLKALEEAVVHFMTADELGPVEGRDESFQAYRLAFDVLPEPEWSARVEHRLNRLKEADQ